MPTIEDDLRAHVESRLPPFAFYARRCEADAYGISHLIAQRTGRRRAPASTTPWTHGWKHLPITDPRQIAHKSSPEDVHLVANERIARQMRDAFGYLRTHAVGVPFVYAEPRGVERIPNSLLVMPPHTLPYLETEWDEAAYVAEVEKLQEHFTHVLACIHRNDVERGNWVGAFADAGIPYAPGTRPRDKYGLQRMQTLFHLFEAMTTNTIGSHVAYAAYCGCRVSICGPYAERSVSDYEKDPVWKGELLPLLEYKLEQGREECIREQYPFLFASPAKASKHVSWAEDELGASCRRDPHEIADLLGWNTRSRTDIFRDVLKSEWKKARHHAISLIRS